MLILSKVKEINNKILKKVGKDTGNLKAKKRHPRGRHRCFKLSIKLHKRSITFLLCTQTHIYIFQSHDHTQRRLHNCKCLGSPDQKILLGSPCYTVVLASRVYRDTHQTHDHRWRYCSTHTFSYSRVRMFR